MQLLIRLWHDESGEMSVVSSILLYTIVALGVTVGLITLRDQIVQEFGDVSVALQMLDQSFTLPNGGEFKDFATDDNTETGTPISNSVDEPACLNVQVAPVPEGTVLTPGGP